MTDAPKCEKCGSEMVLEHSPDYRRQTMRCPLDPKDCRIKGLERQLEEAKAQAVTMAQAFSILEAASPENPNLDHAASIFRRVKKAESERDAALKARDEAMDQVLVLRDAILPIYAPSLDGIGNPCICPNTGQGRNIESALSSTSALAAQRKREIQAEAVEAAIKGVLANFVYGCKDSELPAMIRAGAEKGAAILNPTEAADAH